jgi:hypothetical protein
VGFVEALACASFESTVLTRRRRRGTINDDEGSAAGRRTTKRQSDKLGRTIRAECLIKDEPVSGINGNDKHEHTARGSSWPLGLVSVSGHHDYLLAQVQTRCFSSSGCILVLILVTAERVKTSQWAASNVPLRHVQPPANDYLARRSLHPPSCSNPSNPLSYDSSNSSVRRCSPSRHQSISLVRIVYVLIGIGRLARTIKFRRRGRLFGQHDRAMASLTVCTDWAR